MIWIALILKRVFLRGKLRKKGLGLFGGNKERTNYGI